VRVARSEDGVGALGGLETGLIRMGSPIPNQFIECGTKVKERSEQPVFERMGNGDRSN